MNRWNTKSLLASGALAFVLCGAGTVRAQYTVTGATPGGGEIIVGNGSLGPLGSATAPVALSAGGFDNVTLSLGSTATTSGQDTIAFVTSHNTLLNNGTVIGAAGAASADGFNAISFNATTLTGETIINDGAVTGGAGPGPGIHSDGGVGIFLNAGDTLGNIALINAGRVAGGSSAGGGGGAAISILSGGIVNNVAVTNSGNAAGGNSSAKGSGGYGIIIGAASSISNITLINSGNATGGDTAQIGSFGGFGIAITSNGTLTNVTVSNSGNAMGGSSPTQGETGLLLDVGAEMSNIQVTNTGNITGGVGLGDPSQATGGAGGFGVSFSAVDLMNNVTFVNSGVVAGGIGNGDGLDGSVPIGKPGGKGGVGIAFATQGLSGGGMNGVTLTNNNLVIGGAGNGNGGNGAADAIGGSAGTGGAAIGFGFTGGVSNDVTLVNNGSIVGGAGNGDGGAGGIFAVGGNGGTGGNGIEFVFEESASASGITLINNGSVIGGAGSGNGGEGGGALISSFPGGNAGTGGNGIAFILQSGAAGGISLVNNGSITGGNGTGTGGLGFFLSSSFITGTNGAGGNGIVFLTGTGGGVLENATVTNFGRITGGNGSNGGPAGAGILATTGNVTIGNWGVISAGQGTSTAAKAGFPAVAISVSGNNNTINLNGHSTVNGTIGGSGVNNVLNLNFTGMTPLAIAGLKAQLASQGWPSTNDFQGTFTVRGVTYFVDPLVLNLNVSSYQLQGVTPNQQAIGASLDSITTNPAPGSSLGNLYNAIDLSGNVPGALEALSPQQYQAYGDLAIANTTAIVQNVDARLNNLRDGSESIDTTGVGGTSDATTTAGYSKDDSKESKNVVTQAAPEKRWGMFATGDGLFFRGNSHDVDLQDDKSNSAGTLAGVDAKIGEHVIAGAFFAYNNTDATLGSSSNSGHATIESYSGGIYGSYHQDGFFVNGLAAYTRNHYSSDRNILFPGFAGTAAANTNGNQESVNIDGGYDWHATDRLTIGPIAGLQYVHLDVNGFNEIGAGAADLNVNSENMDSLQSRVGGRINYHLLTSTYSSFAADLHAAYQHEFLDDSRGIGASFAGSGLTPFSVQTTSPLRDAAVVGLGLNFTFHERLTLFADYELLMWRASYFEQTINGGGRISF